MSNEEIQIKAKELVKHFASPLDVFKINSASKRNATKAIDLMIGEIAWMIPYEKRVNELKQIKQAIENL